MQLPKLRTVILAAASWSLVLACVRAEQPFSFAATPGKLPKDVVPRHYALTVRPDVATLTTEGEETVDLEVLKPTSVLMLNALDLDITGAAVDGAPVGLPSADAAAQTIKFSLAQLLAPGKHTLKLAFRGKIVRTAQGLYCERYRTPSGEKQMLGTQMESTDARRMFPCWDEPVFRATFQLTTTVPVKQIAISNTPVESERPLPGGAREVTFGRTPAMASYLVVLCMGEFEVLRGEVDGVQLGIVTTEGKRDQGRYALEATKEIVHYYNTYFGVKYPLPKLDLIAVPGGFGGAMENWGGITFNEAILLFDPADSSQATRERVYAVIAHEVAHQWFGDLVTMAWWDNLWLNEGFASWMGTKATDHFNPGWQVWLRANADKQRAMERDSHPSTHAIQQPIHNEDEAADAFDAITYLKGQGFLRMVETYLGEDTFRAGIRRYIAAHAYSNSTTADLWTALEEASGKPVRAFAANWTEQPGFPVVNVSTRSFDGRTQVTLTQEHFTLNDPAPAARIWQIPVTLAPADDPAKRQTVLLEGGKDVELLSVAAGEPIIANVGNTGFFRVAYSPEETKALTAKFPLLEVADQINLVSDTGALVDAGRAGVASYLELVGRIHRDDTSLALWQQVNDSLSRLDDLERGRPGRAAFRRWYIERLREPFSRLGWEARAGEPSNDALLRALVINQLGYLGDQEVIAEARARFARFVAAPNSLAANLRTPVSSIVGRYADAATWEKLYGLARSAEGIEEQRRYYGALQFVADPALAARTLALALTDEQSTTFAVRMVTGVAFAGDQPELAWDYAREHADALLTKLPAFARNGYFPSIARAFNDANRADELEAFVAQKLPPEARAETTKASDQIRFKAALKVRVLPELDAWIARQG
jgi:aminopeptidase N